MKVEFVTAFIGLSVIEVKVAFTESALRSCKEPLWSCIRTNTSHSESRKCLLPGGRIAVRRNASPLSWQLKKYRKQEGENGGRVRLVTGSLWIRTECPAPSVSRRSIPPSKG